MVDETEQELRAKGVAPTVGRCRYDANPRGVLITELTRPLKVTIEAIDFVYNGVPHSLRVRWLFMEGRGRGTDMRYVYSPLRGLVDVQGNE